MKRIFATSPVLLSLGFLVSASMTSATGSVYASSSPKVTLTFSWWGNTDRAQRTEKAIALFEKQYPNIQIKPQFDGSFTDYMQKLATEIAGNNAPDIMQMNTGYITAFAKQGAFMNLSKLGISTKGMSKTMLDAGVVSGKLDGVTNSINSFGLVINTALLNKAGIKVTPNTRWTWSQFADVVNTIHSKLGIYGVEDPEGTSAIFMQWAREHGQDMYSSDYKKVGYTPDDLTSWFNYWSQLRKDGSVPEGQVTAASAVGSPTDLMVTGKSAMVFIQTEGLSQYLSMTNEPLMLLLPPYQPGEPSGYSIRISQYWSISSKTKYPKQAAEFVNFLLNNIQVNKYFGVERGIPPTVAMQKAIEPSVGSVGQKEIEFQAVLNKMATAAQIDPPAGAQIGNVWTSVSSALTYDQTTPQAAARQIIDQSNSALQQ